MNSIFKITSVHNQKLEDYKNKAMSELNEFFGKKWIYNTPKIILVDDRETIDKIREEDTNRSIVGWFWRTRAIFILNPVNFESESSHRYSEIEIERLIKHELCHVFFNMTWGVSNYKWINEGLSIYIAGQLEKYKTPKKFVGFLEPDNRREIYWESGSAIKLLIDHYGKEKLFEFFEAQKNTNERDDLDRAFEKVYGQKLEYDFFNHMLTKH